MEICSKEETIWIDVVNVKDNSDTINADGVEWKLYSPSITTGYFQQNIITGTAEIPKKRDIEPFKCPCCNGNSYKEVGNKIICEYCGTEFLER